MQITWQADYMTYRSHDIQNTWQADHMTYRSHDIRSHDILITWQADHMTGRSHDRQITWHAEHMTYRSHDIQITWHNTWQADHMTCRSHDHAEHMTEITWRDNVGRWVQIQVYHMMRKGKRLAHHHTTTPHTTTPHTTTPHTTPHTLIYILFTNKSVHITGCSNQEWLAHTLYHFFKSSTRTNSIYSGYQKVPWHNVLTMSNLVWLTANVTTLYKFQSMESI